MSSVASAGDWTQDGGNAQRTGYTSESPTGSWTYAWGWNGPNSSTGTSNQHLYDAPLEGRIVTGGNYVFCPAGSNGLYALNKSNGAQAWRFSTATVNATPAYEPSTGMLYVPGANGTLYKLDTANNGSVSASYNAGNAINKSVLLVGSYAYVVTDDGHLHKVTTSNMTAAWGSAYAANSSGHTPPAYSASKACIVFATADLYIHAVNDSNGTQKWRVKPSNSTAGYPYEYKYTWPVIADQHGYVLIRQNLGSDSLWSGPNTGNKYPTTNSAIRTFLTSNPQWQSVFVLNLDNGNTAFTPAVGPGYVEDWLNDTWAARMGNPPVVKVTSDGKEVAYLLWRNGDTYDSSYDARWESHMGEMVLDGTSVSGYAAGDVRFVDFIGNYMVTDEQCPMTMAGDTLFHAHWGFSESATITDRSASKGNTRSNPITSTLNASVIRRQQQSGTPNTTTHWTTSGLTLYQDGRYHDGPGWWTYWNAIDPPASPNPTGYSTGFRPRYTIVADGLVLVEGNGGDVMALRFAPGGGGDTTAPGTISNLSAPSSTSNSVTLNWTAPGDDGSTGTASSYDIRRSTSTITEANWGSATQVTGEPTPAAAGTAQSMTVSGLSASTTYYFAMKTSDEVPNTSALSNVVSKATTANNDTTAPGAISNLSAPSSDSSSVTLNWTAPGDDGTTGTAASYDIRRSTSTITDANWASATQVTGEPTPAAAGTAQSMTVSGLNASTTYYFAMKTSDEVPNTSGLSNVVSKATTAASSNLLTQGDFQAGTAFTNATYTAGTSSDGVWYSSSLTNTANAGDAGSGDYAAKVNNNWSDLRLFQGVAAPASGTQMTLSFKYIRPSGITSTVKVYGLTSGQAIQPWAGGTLQGTQLFSYDLSTQSSWASVNNQTFTVSATYAKLVVIASVGGDANICVDDFVLSGGGGGGDTTAPSAVNNLSAPSFTSSAVTLNWTATGDDNSTGTASSYDIRYSTSTITTANWGSATPCTGEPTPKASGQAETFTVTGLNAGVTYYFAMKVSDEVPNTSGLSNVVSKTTAGSGPFFSDDFQGETTGQVPSKWTCNNSSFQTVAESTNKLLKNVGTDSHVWPSDCDSTPSRWQNFEMLCRVRNMQQIDFRLPGSGSSLRLQATTGGVTLYEMPGWTSKGSRAALTAGTWYWMRLQCNGSSVKVRFWADGTSEPSTTDISATTTVTATGKVDFNYQGNISIDDVTVSSSFTQMN